LIAPALPYSLPCSAADVLGLGSYTQQELFAIYVEFTLLCYTDPGCVLRLLCLLGCMLGRAAASEGGGDTHTVAGMPPRCRL
jgi:hypothetical protein